MIKILEYILKIQAKIILWRYKPIIVAVTGSVGKTSTKEAIYRVLKKKFKVRRNLGNYNNEIGVPLTILGSKTGGSSIFAWLIIFLKTIKIIIWEENYPKILVLEMGVDKPGDMKYLTSFIPVNIGVFTAIGEFPVHIEFFPEKDKLVEEKALLIKSIQKDGLAVLNYDDLSVRMVGDELSDQIKKINYGFGQGADLRIDNFELEINNFDKGDFGINFKMDYQGSIVPIRLLKALGKQQVYAIAAATSVGSFFNINMVEVSEAFREYYILPGRTNLIKGVKNTWIIDDTYNASPLAVSAALDILEVAGASDGNRKIAVLGDMMELGVETENGHRQVGKKAASIADLLFTVGERSRFISDEAKKHGLAKDKIFEFSQSSEAGIPLQQEIKKGDIILIKGSRSIKMEKIVKEIMAEPEKANELLVGQN
ncbi:MAG: UDP-N-acetylmuramoyl-tripeptide--D-alanyl-D-alanine ligase [Candidatus Portnoybacteria bacterium]|nr:UDP-N-acetylmuramoyl-tripeptide--D-alanyl-D-alanine ligase [Candidatus Portnoybacteria bacterium]